MSFQDLLGDLSSKTFADEYYLKLPFSRPGGCRHLVSLGSWSAVDKILEQADADVLVVRQGQRWESTRAPSPDEARRLHSAGYTVLARHAERHDPGIATLATGFAEDFCCPVDVHLYCTPGSQFGFGWHYDAEDVFILQTEGSKEYSLRKNTVNPWPLVETIPQDMAYGAEQMPLMKCLLHAGDWLYIPAGYWHRGDSNEDAISLAVGVMSTAAIELYDFLRSRLLSSLRWRQRLPSPGRLSGLAPDELVEQYVGVCQELAADLQRQMSDPAAVRDFLATKRAALSASWPQEQLPEPTATATPAGKARI